MRPPRRNEAYEAYLLRLTELEVAARVGQRRWRPASAPPASRCVKDFDTFDFTAAPDAAQAEGAGAGPRRVDRAALQLLPDRRRRHGEDARRRSALGLALCRLGKRVRFVTAAELVTQLEEAQQQHRLDRLLTPTGPPRPADRGRTGLPVVQPGRRGAAVPGVRRPLRAAEPAGDEQPGVQRVGPGVPGRADDGGAAGPADAPVPHLRDERRKLSLPGVDEGQEGQGPQEGKIGLPSPRRCFPF